MSATRLHCRIAYDPRGHRGWALVCRRGSPIAEYSFSGVPVVVTVAATGTSDINAFGAQGGASSAGYSHPIAAGGYGAEMDGIVTLAAGESWRSPLVA